MFLSGVAEGAVRMVHRLRWWMEEAARCVAEACERVAPAKVRTAQSGGNARKKHALDMLQSEAAYREVFLGGGFAVQAIGQRIQR